MEAVPEAVIATRPRLHRRAHGRVVAGVAGGLADRMGVGDGYVRAAFVVLAAIWGFGVFLYVILWIVTFERVADEEPRQAELNQVLGIAALFLGFLFILKSLGLWPSGAVVPVVTAVSFGLAALWDKGAPLPRIFGGEGETRPRAGRVFVGLILLIGGLAFTLNSIQAVADFGQVVLAVLVTGLGLGLTMGPWLVRLGNDLGRERRERIRQEERAEMAAHLHDSVLQTLALIQRTDDPKRMSTLARAQERELRAWLYERAPVDRGDLVSTALRAAADRVEHDHHVPVEVVTVGDLEMGKAGQALAGAAAEAMVNAAKHSGADRVSVYLEVEDERADLWVSDQGSGFSTEDVGSDRRGMSHSIVDRMVRNGGQAEVTSRLGEGTEVHLWFEGARA
ncbi:MAG TPA: PspC domain-containing protein [Acidimicrobiia bacterium]